MCPVRTAWAFYWILMLRPLTRRIVIERATKTLGGLNRRWRPLTAASCGKRERTFPLKRILMISLDIHFNLLIVII